MSIIIVISIVMLALRTSVELIRRRQCSKVFFQTDVRFAILILFQRSIRGNFPDLVLCASNNKRGNTAIDRFSSEKVHGRILYREYFPTFNREARLRTTIRLITARNEPK